MEITATAQQKLRSFLTEPERAYRLSTSWSGCQGLTFHLTIIRHPRPDDVLQSCPDVPIYIERSSLAYLEEVVMDYTEGPFQSGFTFKHPHSCRCGQSFAAAHCPNH